MVDLVAAFEVGTGLLEMERHFVFYTLAHGIEHPGIVTDAGFIPGFPAADNLVDLLPVLFQKAFDVDRAEHRLMDNGFMADRQLQKDGQPLVCHVLVLAGAADVHVPVSVSPVLRKADVESLRALCDKEEIKVCAGAHHGP